MQEFLELDVRRRIYNCIENSPGLHFRELQRRLNNIATGSLDYHLHYMKKHNVIKVEKDGNFTRYYPWTRNWGDEEKKIISVLRQKNIRHIIIYMLEKKKANPIRMSHEIGISASTMSWYLKKMKELGIIREFKRGRFRNYTVADRESMIKYLVAYRSSFLDEIVDNFIDALGED